jgi:hypothetical protein
MTLDVEGSGPARTGESRDHTEAMPWSQAAPLKPVRGIGEFFALALGWNIRGTGVDVHGPTNPLVLGGRLAAANPRAENRGTHVIHTGPEHLSYLRVPVLDNPR